MSDEHLPLAYRLMIGIACGLAVGAVAVSVVALSRSSSPQAPSNNDASQIALLRSQVAILNTEHATDDAAIEALRNRYDASSSALTNCVPELQTEIEGLSIENSFGQLIINNDSQISHDCGDLLYGTGYDTQ